MDNLSFLTLNTLFAVTALLLPAGLILVAGGALKGRRPAKSAVAGLGAVALAAVSYWAIGFGLHLGGVGLVSDLAGLEELVWEWASPLNLEWGVMGLRGFLLLDEAATPAALNLYLAYLPAVAVVTVLPLLSLRERLPGWMAALGGLLLAALIFPVAANWFSGGGWLMHAGDTLGQGHGYVDPTGLSTAAFIGGLAALLGILLFGRRLPPLAEGENVAPPAVQLPVLAVLGAFLFVTGAMALAGANPIFLASGAIGPRYAVNLVLAVAGGTFLPCLYTWFTTGSAEPLLAAQGAVAGALSVAAAAAFVPPWAALALGAAAGLLVPLLTFVLRYVLRIEDPTGAVPVGLLGGGLGILAVGLFADGLAGQGWHGIGPESYLGVPGQGVTGFFPAPGLAPDWPGQINAQLIGMAAIAALTVLLAGALFLVFKVLLLLWRAVPAPEEKNNTVGDREQTADHDSEPPAVQEDAEPDTPPEPTPSLDPDPAETEEPEDPQSPITEDTQES